MAIGGRFKWDDQSETPNTLFGIAEYHNGQWVFFNAKAGRFGDNKDAYEHFMKLHALMRDGVGVPENGAEYTVGPWLTFDAETERFTGESGAVRHAAGWTDGFLNEWSEITLILGTLNIGFPGFSEVINSSAPSRNAVQRFRASAAATPWAEAKARASFPKASLNGSSCLTWAK
jgi:hypothetical protein